MADVRREKVREWDGLVRRAVVDGAGMSMGRSLNVEALYTLVGLPRFEHQQWAIRGEEDLVLRNCDYPSSRTGRARDAARRSGRLAPLRKVHKTTSPLKAAPRVPPSPPEPVPAPDLLTACRPRQTQRPQQPQLPRQPQRSRRTQRPPQPPVQPGEPQLARQLQQSQQPQQPQQPRQERQMYVCSRAAVARAWLQKNVSAVFREEAPSEPFVAVEAQRPWDPADPCWSEWRPDRCPTLRWIYPGSVRRLVWAFTDGSTGEQRGMPSGCGVVLTE